MPDRNLTQVETVFHAVLELPPNDREKFLEQACNGDQSLYAEVSSLISAFDSRGGFIEEPALSLGFQVLSKSAEQSMTGKSIGPYKVISRLGKGGMGEVYLAEDTKLGRKVALKFISQEFVGDNWARRQLIKEAQAVAKLDHPNICPVYGIEETNEHTFIVMNYVEGETLADLIRKKAISTEQVVPLALQIVSALAEAQAHGIIHRDIKPRNIMVTPSGKVKVLDFGLAKTIQQRTVLDNNDESISQLSQNGVVPGTVAYMSPEQLRGEKLDYRSDIFSVGTVLYEMVAGRNPFAHGSGAETISAVLSTLNPPLAGSKETRRLERCIKKCLEKERQQRYQSASELLIDLENLAEQDFRRNVSITPRLILAVSIVILLVVALFLFLTQKPPVRRVAVLPFSNLSANSEMNYVEGLNDAIINSLLRTRQVAVLSSSIVSRYRGAELDVVKVGNDLHVDLIVAGRLINQGDKVILRAELIDVSNGQQLWSHEYPVQTSALITIQRSVSEEVISSLALSNSDDLRRRQNVGQTQNPEAFREYFDGRYYWRHRDKDESYIQRAIASYQKSIEIDPSYALPHAGLADAYLVSPTVAYGALQTKDVMSKAKAYAKQALAIDEELAEAHTSLGVVHLRFDWDWPAAEREFKRAIELNPDYAEAHFWYGELLAVTGEFEKAILESEKAKELDPVSTITNMAPGRAYYRARQYDRAIEYLKAVLQVDPKNQSAAYLLGFAYLGKSMFTEALEIFNEVYRNKPKVGAAALGYTLAKLNRRSEALKLLQELQSYPPEDHIPPQESAIIYMGLDDRDQAFKWFEKASEERFAPLIFIKAEPFYDSLRSDPRYPAFVRRMNLTP